MMKTIFSCVSFFLFLFPLYAQIKVPSASPEQSIHQEFGISSIDLSYSRPSVKNRKIFGDLVPFGKVWRTGANGPTIINFGDEVTIGGKKIAAGKYGLVTIPGSDKWTVIITKQLDIVSSADYKEQNDVIRISCKPVSLKDKLESFSMQFENIASDNCELWLRWDHTAVFFPIKTDIDSRVMAGIEKAMAGSDPPYFEAAYYYFNNGRDLHKAEEWAQKATEKDPQAYYIFYLLASIQAKNGEKAKALTSANKSLEISTQLHRDDYIALNKKLIGSLK